VEDEEVQSTTEVSTTQPQRVVTTKRKVVKEPAVKVEHPQTVYETKKTIFRTYQVVWYVLCVIEVLLAFRFVLKLLASNPSSGFTSLIYLLSDPFAVPFLGVLRIGVVPTTGSVFEWSTLIAMTVYWLLAYGIIQLFQFVKPVTPDEVEETVDTQ
jgi:hypothetical protein